MDGKNEGVTVSEESSSREAVSVGSVDIQSVNIIIEPYILYTWSRMFIISCSCTFPILRSKTQTKGPQKPLNIIGKLID